MIDLKLIEDSFKELLPTMGYELTKFCYEKEGKENFLRVEIDKSDSISMDDIVKVSEALSDLLDKIDTSKDAYMLDVSTSGIEKSIEVNDLKNHLNDYVMIHVKELVKGVDEITGTIIDTSDEGITMSFFIKGAPKKAVINYENILDARKAIKF